MRPGLDILKELIKDDALVTAEKDPYDNIFLELNEPGEGGSSGYKIKILNTPEDTIAIKSDMFPSPNNIFKNTKGECRRGDFVIISRDETKNWIIYIEMKRGKHSRNTRIMQQLQGSRCFVDYCRSIVQTFWRKPKFLEENDYQQRYVCVDNISVQKRPSIKIRNSSLHDCPENMLKISSPSPKGIWFNELVGPAN